MKKSKLEAILNLIPGDPDIRLAGNANLDDGIGCIIEQGSEIILMTSDWRDYIHHFDISKDEEEILYHDS